ncbi:amidohydrolase family protein [Actinoplanes sp. L3-i22]|uniref:amidohydrolase family protein n=1 Tax=Actinoplanes sp. L3-i22 TaxID=2836373 RepID=UPI001C7407DC|nr:amidohydrolase family protein [Actinoplanes sp. L3-i22]BCY08256.1 amidohydrolase [Actinoplanes sp. L3-i22]
MSTLLLRDATVVDTRAGGLRPGTDVLIENGRIAAVGPGLPAPPGAEVVQASARYVVPGYNDMHAHPLGQRAGVDATLELMLAHGITGFRQMHGDLGLLRARAAGTLRLPAASPALLALPGPLLTMLNTATPEAAATAVREQVTAGADFVKSAAMTPDGFFDAQAEALRLGVPIVGHLPAGLDVVRASKLGVRSVEHFGAGLGVLGCCSGHDEIPATGEQRLRLPSVRLPFMDRILAAVLRRIVLNPVQLNKPADLALLDEAIHEYDEGHAHRLGERFAADGTWHVPTLIRQKTSKLCDDPGFPADPDLRYMTPATRRTWDGAVKRFARFTPAQRATLAASHRLEYHLARTFDQAGVRMLAGTDSSGAVWIVPGAGLHDEIDLLAEAGIAPLRLLQMLTLNAAEFLDATATMGTVEPGRDADLVLLGANPLDDTANLHRVTGVIRSGTLYPEQRLTAMKDRLVRTVG